MGCCWLSPALGTCSRERNHPAWPGQRRPSRRTELGQIHTCKKKKGLYLAANPSPAWPQPSWGSSSPPSAPGTQRVAHKLTLCPSPSTSAHHTAHTSDGQFSSFPHLVDTEIQMDTVEQPAVFFPLVLLWSTEQHPVRAVPYCSLEMVAPLPGLLSSHISLPASLTLPGFLHLCGLVQVFIS